MRCISAERLHHSQSLGHRHGAAAASIWDLKRWPPPAWAMPSRPENGTARRAGRDAGTPAEIASATDLPVSADLENGFGDAPGCAAETIRLAAAAGVVGGSIEDATEERPENPIYEQGSCRGDESAPRPRRPAPCPFTFTLTARAENYLHGRPDLKDTIERLQAYQEAGADVLYAPGLADQGRHRRRGQLRGSSGECPDGAARRATEPGANSRRWESSVSAWAARFAAPRWAHFFAPRGRCASTGHLPSLLRPPVPAKSWPSSNRDAQ